MSGDFSTVFQHLATNIFIIFQTIWDHLQASGTILDYLFTTFYYLRPFETILSYLGPSNPIWDHLRPLSLSFEGSITCHIVPQPDFLWFHIHVIILNQFVSHIHLGCKNNHPCTLYMTLMTPMTLMTLMTMITMIKVISSDKSYQAERSYIVIRIVK